MLTIGELMTPEPRCVLPDVPLASCAVLMESWGVRRLLVVDDERRLLGAIPDVAVFRRVGDDHAWGPREDAPDIAAGAAMQPVGVRAPPDVDALQVMRQLLVSRSDTAVIVDPTGVVLGVFTEHDVVRMASVMLPASYTSEALPTRRIVTVELDDEVARARMLMDQFRIRHILVTDEGLLYGVLSYRDLAGTAERPIRARDAVRVRPPYFVRGTLVLAEAARAMSAWTIGCVPLLDDQDRPMEVVTRTDILRALIDHLEEREP